MSSVYQCTAGDEIVVELAPGQYVPGCATGGAWVDQVPPFDAATWFADPQNSYEWGQYFAAGFTLVSVALITGIMVRLVLRMFWGDDQK